LRGDQAPFADSGRGSRTVRVMLIEDDALMRGVIADALGGEGMEVDGLASAEAGARLARAHERVGFLARELSAEVPKILAAFETGAKGDRASVRSMGGDDP
jgi:DNA-binding response OmpR family regulator